VLISLSSESPSRFRPLAARLQAALSNHPDGLSDQFCLLPLRYFASIGFGVLCVGNACGVQLTYVMPHRVYLSLGSNVGQREIQLREAIARLEAVGRVISTSSLYETEPVEMPVEALAEKEQSWFLNCALSLETNRSPQELMKVALEIEREMGRVRTQKKGPRTIDIDILLFGDLVMDSPDLTIPHPAMHERRFVLEPLAEIAGDVRHPVLKKSVKELLKELPAGQIVRKI
jgi:2-amino-4-hydroxy-6-hydroxymethyldihydropteridine diphosphokinase